MSTRNHYNENFKQTLVELYHNGKTQASLIKELQKRMAQLKEENHRLEYF